MSISVSDLISVCGINLFVSRDEIILKYWEDFEKKDISPPKMISSLSEEEKKKNTNDGNKSETKYLAKLRKAISHMVSSSNESHNNLLLNTNPPPSCSESSSELDYSSTISFHSSDEEQTSEEEIFSTKVCSEQETFKKEGLVGRVDSIIKENGVKMILELKKSSKKMVSWDSVVYPNYIAQCQMYIYLTGLEKAKLVRFDDFGNERYVYVERNDEIINKMLEVKESLFSAECIDDVLIYDNLPRKYYFN